LGLFIVPSWFFFISIEWQRCQLRRLDENGGGDELRIRSSDSLRSDFKKPSAKNVAD